MQLRQIIWMTKKIIAKTQFSTSSWFINCKFENLNAKLHSNRHFITELSELNIDQISMAFKKIASFYENDLDETELISECEIAKHNFFKNPDILSCPGVRFCEIPRKPICLLKFSPSLKYKINAKLINESLALKLDELPLHWLRIFFLIIQL